MPTLKKKLELHYRNEPMNFFTKLGCPTMLCFDDETYSNLRQSWKMEQKNAEDEKIRVIKEAAAIIRSEIICQISDIDFYPPSNSFLQDLNQSIPKSLVLFINEVI